MTTAAILTSPGRGAVASIALWGEHATAIVDELFSASSGVQMANAPPGRIFFGNWRASGEEVVVCRRTAGEFEIHCHGGQAAVRAVMASLAERGCREAPWTHWSSRQTSRRLAAEAVEALAQANTLCCAGILLDQFHGALDRELDSCATLLESPREIDWRQVSDRLSRLAGRWRVGKHLTAAFQMVIAGRPNVGKSSLMNKLAGYERSIVFNQPGTTRDVVTLRTAIDGWPVEISDTAGLRDGGDVLESAGVRLAGEHIAAADLILLVFDASQPRLPEDDALAAQWPSALLVCNKADLGPPPPNARCDAVISARTGQGIEALLEVVARRLVPDPPVAGEPVPFTSSQEQTIREALCWLDQDNRPAAIQCLRRLP